MCYYLLRTSFLFLGREPSDNVLSDTSITSSGLSSGNLLTGFFNRGSNQQTGRKTGPQSSPRSSSNFPSTLLPNQSPVRPLNTVSGLLSNFNIPTKPPPDSPSTQQTRRPNSPPSIRVPTIELPGLTPLPNVSVPDAPPPNASQSISPDVAISLSPSTAPPTIVILPPTVTFIPAAPPSDPLTPVVLDTDPVVGMLNSSPPLCPRMMS